MTPGDRLNATFAPRRTDDLKPGVADYVGTKSDFEVLWKIDEGPYAGEFAMRLPLDWECDGVWTPSGDFRSI